MHGEYWLFEREVCLEAGANPESFRRESQKIRQGLNRVLCTVRVQKEDIALGSPEGIHFHFCGSWPDPNSI